MITTAAFFHSESALAGVSSYVSSLLQKLREPGRPVDSTAAVGEIADAVFGVLTSREFCYLSKRRVAAYYDSVVARLRADIEARRPLQFYYDIGGGYHASLAPRGAGGLRFEVGLGELCILSQIASFHARVTPHYAPGVEFHLVIDNLCALLVNDIPVENTRRYCDELRTLIDELVTEPRIRLLVESERFDPAGYCLDALPATLASLAEEPTEAEIENVSRFLGRACSPAEARERMARYKVVSDETEKRIGSLVDGVRMTQRATPGTLGFRPFVGADSRIQAGHVSLTPSSRGGLRPFLLTSRNMGQHRYVSVDCSHLLPRPIQRVTLAAKVAP